MKRKTTRMIIKKTLIVGCMSIGIAVIVFALLHIMRVVHVYNIALSEDSAAMQTLDANQYIHNKYVDWKEIQLFNGYSFMLPDEWKFARNEAEASLEDGGRIIASGWAGTAVPANEGEKLYVDRIQGILGYRPKKEDREEYWTYHTGQLGQYGKHIFENESGETQTYYYLYLIAFPDYVELYFGPIENDADDALLEIIMAMAHSFQKKDATGWVSRGRFS